ncbi:hypothetical protein ACI8B_280078 [Acinetobacter proteolyticus]|uniref:Uncharacterized protein n=1 Tax=Acinetobacter proteolyticus TaxID=1776741 RepID=A0A653K5L4_9GAMM|nr:hypothetical protein ACI8B_280078 [Acinetobacter proteolyticus]
MTVLASVCKDYSLCSDAKNEKNTPPFSFSDSAQSSKLFCSSTRR